MWGASLLTGGAATLASTLVLFEPTEQDMVVIPGGPAILGGANIHSLPGPQSYAVPGFLVDRFEVTNAAYRAFVAATGAQPPAFSGEPELDQDDQPVTGVHWAEARAYCNWAGKRLLTEMEWEKAARGPSGRTYPWGNDFLAENAHLTGTEPVGVGAFPQDDSPYGVRGLAGNVSEWVADSRVAQAGVCGAPHDHGGSADAQTDPDGAYLAELLSIYGSDSIDICRNPEIPQSFAPLETCAFIKGNNWSGRPHMTVASNRMWDYSNSYADFVGFRCARSLPDSN